MPEDAYVEALLRDLDFELRDAPETRPLVSIFMGGGTPSLFSDRAIGRVLERVQKRVNFAPDIANTPDANPGPADAPHFAGYVPADGHRLSTALTHTDPAPP